MKRKNFTLLLTAFLLIAGTLYFSTTLQKQSRILFTEDIPIILEQNENDRQEEVKDRMRHEVLMTKDPVLGYVPREVLPVAEQQTAQLLNSYITRNGTQALLTWTERGPNNMPGRARGVIIDRNDATGNTVIVGSVSGGMWRTTNFLAATPTWTQIASVSSNLAITCIAQDPSNFNTMYAGTGEGFGNADAVRGLGIYRSLDGGLTWSLLAATTTGGAQANDMQFIQDIVVYSNGNVYAAAISIFCNRGGIFKSTNAGISWTRVIGTVAGACNASDVDLLGYDLEISAGGDIYASIVDFSQIFPPTNGDPAGKIYKSPAGMTVGDVGTWTNITPPPNAGNYWQRIELACAPSDNNVVYAIFQGSGNEIDSIMRSDNAGAAWVNIDNTTLWCDNGSTTSVDFSRGQAWYDLIIAVKPDDAATVFAGGVDVMKSTNSGGTWVQNTQWIGGCGGLPVIHADIHNIIYLPGSTSQLIVVNDGGIYYSSDNGTTYSNKGGGFNTTQYYANAIHPTAGSNYMLGGSQDNGSHKFSSAGLNTVATATGGDGGFCFIDQDDPTYQITSNTRSIYRISRDGGTSFAFTANFAGGRFINPTDYDNTGNFIYCAGAGRNLRRIQNITAGAIQAFSFSISANTNLMISAVKVDPNTPNRVWIAYATAEGTGSQVAEIYRVDNANDNMTISATQVTIPGGLPAGAYISSIDVENGNANHLLITLSNFGVVSVWESTDAGASWINVENNLPNFPVRWGIFIPAGVNPGSGTNAIGGVMLATELGVWSTMALSGGTTNWVQNSTSIGNVRTDMIEYRAADNVVATGTHGRGVFTATLFTSLPVDFVSFTGRAEERVNKLIWKVENEVDNTGYEIQRRYKGDGEFVKIGFVPARNNNARANDYSFDDVLVDLGKMDASYRLKQIDIDGKYSYSNVVSLQRKTSGKFVEYTAVSGNQLFIRINGGNNDQIMLRLFDISGRLLKKSSIMNKTQYIDISALPRAAFVVDIVHPDGRRFTKKMIY